MKILQKHQAGEGSVNLHLEGAVTTNQDGGLRKLLVKDNSSVGWHLISPALVDRFGAEWMSPKPGQLSGPNVLLR